jgi:hypothetical protein
VAPVMAAVGMRLPAWAAAPLVLMALALLAVEPARGQEQWPRNEGGEGEEDEGTSHTVCVSLALSGAQPCALHCALFLRIADILGRRSERG